MWIAIEWLGTILALSGAIIMASKKLSHVISWILWILSNIAFISLFAIETKQSGLLSMQVAGLMINILGFWQWYKKTERNKIITEILYYLSILCLIGAGVFGVKLIMNPTLYALEWIGSLLAISAALLLSSYHVHSKYCWLLWAFGNLTILILTLFTKQYGVMVLQIGFSITNILGIWQWLIKPKLKIKTPALVNSSN